MSKLKVLLADDHPNLLEKVTGLLEPTFEVVGRVADGQSLIEAAINLNPDVIVTDISMPILNGIEAASQLKESGCKSKIVFLTVHADPEYVLRCFVTGALGYVVKRRMATDTLACYSRGHGWAQLYLSKFPPSELSMTSTPNRLKRRQLSASSSI